MALGLFLYKAEAAVAVASALWWLGCSSDPKPEGQLILAIDTDMDLPKDVDSIGVSVTAFGTPYHDDAPEVGPDGLRIPATLNIVSEGESDEVEIRVWSLLGQEARTLREVVTTVPTDRSALLRVAVEWLCDDSAIVENAGDQPTNRVCENGETCVAGKCVTTDVDVDDLPDYEPELVFGGASGPGRDGTCFDTVACFSEGVALDDIDMTTCSAPAPDGDLNVAIVPSRTRQQEMDDDPSDGICGDDVCFIPLDRSRSRGFSVEGGRVTLPAAVCQRLSSGRARAVVVSTSCESKTEGVPTCGPWSSVTSDPGTFEGPGPALPDGGISVIENDGGAPDGGP